MAPFRQREGISLARMGHRVVAAEPTAAMCLGGSPLHPLAALRVADDALPLLLAALTAWDEVVERVMLNAVPNAPGSRGAGWRCRAWQGWSRRVAG